MHRLLQLCAFAILVSATAWAQNPGVSQAHQYLQDEARAFGAPLPVEARVTAAYTSAGTGLTHVYFRQTINGIDVRDGDVTITLATDGSVFHAAGSFFDDIEASRGVSPTLSAQDAAHAAAAHLGFLPTESLEILDAPRGADRTTTLSDGGIARKPIEANLLYEPTDQGLVLTWDVTFHEIEDHHVWSLRIDAATGQVIAQNDYVVHDHWGDADGNLVGFHKHATDLPMAPEIGWQPPSSAAPAAREANRSNTGPQYRVFAYPLESPNHGGRSLITNPADPVASPHGWHDTTGDGIPNYTISRGNNVFAYVDANNTNQPSGTDAIPDGGDDLIFDFPIDFTQSPSTYRFASVTNLFYWNNLLHDILYHYGFDEAAGNFQQTNFTIYGQGNDAVRAEAQDGGGMNNANFFTPVDGQAPRMQMYLWNTATPHIDGDFDNGIIAHEYAHGWSIRLTGGPNNVSCLWNQEQAGEGWSDYLGLIVSMRFLDYADQGRGIGTFALNQSTSGNGIRPAPYSRNMAVNGYTYGNLPSMAVPHGVGFVWATMLWDMTWDLIDLHGFDQNFHTGTGGNNIALRLVSEAMKLQPCSPGFVDSRDAILAADQALYDGAHQALIWQAFARRGLGYSANQGSSGSSNDGTEAFDLPPGLERSLTFETDAEMLPAGELVTYTITLLNGAAMNPLPGLTFETELPEGMIFGHGSASDGGVYNPETRTVTFADIDIDTDETVTRSFMALADVDGGSVFLFEDDVSDGGIHWSPSNGVGSANWSVRGGVQHTGSRAWYARNAETASDQYLTINEAIVPTAGTVVRVRHQYDTEATYDGGVVELSVENGPWEDAGEFFVSGGYNGTIRNTAAGNPLAGRPAFTGDSGPYAWSEIDLSTFAGQEVRLRFRLGTDNQGGYPDYFGWLVDHVIIVDEVAFTAELCVDSQEPAFGCTARKTIVSDPIDGAPVLEGDLDPISITLHPGESDQLSIAISNEGDRQLVFTIGAVEEAAWLTVTPTFISLDPDGEATLTIEVDTENLEPGLYEVELALVSNDRDHALVTIPVTASVAAVSGEDGAETLPNGFLLEAAHPNPFSDRAELNLQVAEVQQVQIVLFDVMGREVARLHDGELVPGAVHRFSVDGSRLASGIYLVHVRGEHFNSTQRITRLR